MGDARLDVRALYAVLDEQRKSRRLSWRQVANEAGVSPSTLTRLAQGKRPDVDGFASLVGWLNMSADQFLRADGQPSQEEPEPLAVISALLRARRELSAESAEALEDIIRVAYERLKEVHGDQASSGVQDTR